MTMSSESESKPSSLSAIGANGPVEYDPQTGRYTATLVGSDLAAGLVTEFHGRSPQEAASRALVRMGWMLAPTAPTRETDHMIAEVAKYHARMERELAKACDPEDVETYGRLEAFFDIFIHALRLVQKSPETRREFEAVLEKRKEGAS